MSRPDPLDALKYACTVVWLRTEGHEDLDDVRELLESLIEPFVDGPEPSDEWRYSDGKPVSVSSEYAPGQWLQTHFLPPGFPRTAGAR
jgi:hypothetical protein